MATRSAIGFRTHTGKIKAVYCHWDGYLEGVGATLENFYKDAKKVRELVNNGNISVLQPTVKKTRFYKATEGTFLNEPVLLNTVQEMIEYYDSCQYFYVFDNDQWIVSTGGNFDKLSDQLKETANG